MWVNENVTRIFFLFYCLMSRDMYLARLNYNADPLRVIFDLTVILYPGATFKFFLQNFRLDLQKKTPGKAITSYCQMLQKYVEIY